MLRAILLSAAAASAAWTPLPDTRCTGDEGQVDGTVPSAAACETLCASRPDCFLFSFCPPGGAEGCGAGGGPQPSSCWFFDLSRLPACTAAKNWTSGSPPEPSPSPPVQPPADWAPRIASGNMAFSGASAETIGAGFFPVVGKGFLAIEMGPLSQPYVNAWPWRDSGSFHLAGVYNGKTWVDPSHRAQLPRLHGFVIAPAGTATLGAAIDFSTAIFYNRTYVNTSACPSTVVEQRAFAHRARRELFEEGAGVVLLEQVRVCWLARDRSATDQYHAVLLTGYVATADRAATSVGVVTPKTRLGEVERCVPRKRVGGVCRRWCVAEALDALLGNDERLDLVASEVPPCASFAVVKAIAGGIALHVVAEVNGGVRVANLVECGGFHGGDLLCGGVHVFRIGHLPNRVKSD